MFTNPHDTNDNMGKTKTNKTRKQQLKKPNDPTLTIQELQKEKLITGKIPDAETSRQIDHIVINHIYRNCIRKAHVQPGWNANMQLQHRRKVLVMQICLKLMRRYKNHTHPESGTNVKYDIRPLRSHPQKLDAYAKQHLEIQNADTKETLTTQWIT